MQKLVEHTYGTHIFMKILLDSGKIHMIDVYLTNSGTVYKTTADHNEAERAEVIAAFKELY